MGFLDVIRWMIFIIIATIAITVGQIITLPHIEVLLKGLPPVPVMHAIMRTVLGVMKTLFHYITIFLIIMYIIYVIIKKFVPNFPIPLKKILLSITPLYELRVAGVFGLFDAIIGIIFSTDSFVNRLVRLARAFGLFLIGPVILLRSMIGGGKKTTITIGGGGSSNNNEKKKPAKEGEFNDQDNTEGEPTYDESITPNENKYIEKEYQQCLSENYVPITENMSDREKSISGFSNSVTKIICDVKKLQYYSTIVGSKYL